MKIRWFMLCTGDVVVANSEYDANEGVFYLKKPMILRSMPHPQNPSQMVVGFYPFIFGTTNDEECSIDISCVVFKKEPNKAIQDAYIQSTTGIQMSVDGV